MSAVGLSGDQTKEPAEWVRVAQWACMLLNIEGNRGAKMHACLWVSNPLALAVKTLKGGVVKAVVRY